MLLCPFYRWGNWGVEMSRSSYNLQVAEPSRALNTTVLNTSVLSILLDLLYLPPWTFFFFLDFTFFIIYDLITFLRGRNSHFPILPSEKCTKEWSNLPKASWMLTLTMRSHSHPFFIALIVSISAKSFRGRGVTFKELHSGEYLIPRFVLMCLQ